MILEACGLICLVWFAWTLVVEDGGDLLQFFVVASVFVILPIGIIVEYGGYDWDWGVWRNACYATLLLAFGVFAFITFSRDEYPFEKQIRLDKKKEEKRAKKEAKAAAKAEKLARKISPNSDNLPEHNVELERANADLRRLRDSNRELRRENSELRSLRNQNTALERANSELFRLRLENQRFRAVESYRQHGGLSAEAEAEAEDEPTRVNEVEDRPEGRNRLDAMQFDEDIDDD